MWLSTTVTGGVTFPWGWGCITVDMTFEFGPTPALNENNNKKRWATINYTSQGNLLAKHAAGKREFLRFKHSQTKKLVVSKVKTLETSQHGSMYKNELFFRWHGHLRIVLISKNAMRLIDGIKWRPKQVDINKTRPKLIRK